LRFSSAPAGSSAGSGALLVVLGLGLALRLLVFLVSQPWSPEQIEKRVLEGDAAEYQAVAEAFLHGEDPGEVGLARTPLYPLYLAGVYAVAGVRPWVAILGQILFAAGTLLLVHRLAARWFGPKTGCVAAALYAIDPHSIVGACALLTDTLYTFLLLASVVLFLESLETRRRVGAVAAGLLLGAGALIRPVGLFLIPVYALVVVFAGRRALGIAVATATMVAVASALPVLPWMIRNQARWGEFAITTKGGSHLLTWVAAYTEVQRTGKPVEVVRAELLAAADSAGAATAPNPFARARIQGEVAKRTLAAHPLFYAKVHIRGVIHVFTNLGTQGIARTLRIPPSKLDVEWFGGAGWRARLGSFFRSKSPAEFAIAGAVGLFLAIVYLAAARGVVRAFVSRRWEPLIVSLGLILYFMAFVGPIGVGRYKLPFIPYLLTLAAVGLVPFGGGLRVETGGGDRVEP
jgi:4-amino-4-deoxy-L-arabinose transferase-like glycosyltransferase